MIIVIEMKEMRTRSGKIKSKEKDDIKIKLKEER